MARGGASAARTGEHRTGGVIWRAGPRGSGFSGKPADRGCLGESTSWVERDGWRVPPPLPDVCQGDLSPMLKTLTLSLSFAVALGLCSVSKAGGLMHSDGYGMASGQCPTVSPQAPCPTPQCAPVCCAPAKKCHLLEGMQGMGNHMNCCFNNLCARMKPKPKCYTYEWVLKKKRVWGCHGGGCGTPGCDTCGIASPQGG